MPDPVPLHLKDVVERGRPIITDIVQNIQTLVADSLRRPAYWHPTGFVVLNLRDIEGLGLVRLHIWPKSIRTKRLGNPEVHAHVFHLTSYVLAGTYIEHQYVDLEAKDGDSYGYRVVPPTGDGIDRLVPDGARYNLELKHTEISTQGTFHNLPAGIYHMTDNPEGQTCATIALISRPQPGRVDHLIGPERHDGIEGRRTQVSDSHLGEALQEIGLHR